MVQIEGNSILQTLHDRLSEFEFPVCQFRVLPLMFPLMAEELPTAMQHVAAVCSNAVDVVTDPRKSTVVIAAGFIFHKLFEPVTGELLVFDVVAFVFFCN